jgi:endonuclease/exonuclease/phosphatase family metal-dependent hydrolase
MHRLTIAVIAMLAASGAAAGNRSDIVVMTQNQYLGADLTPIIAATDPASFNAAVIGALQSVAANNFPLRARTLAESIAERGPHLVGLQEVFEFDCIDFGSEACRLFDAALNDHLELTLEALAATGGGYYVAATVDNLTIPSPDFPFPGLPVFLDSDPDPDAFITVRDRDVILAREDVATVPVSFWCAKPSVDGCNFDVVAAADTLAGPISRERGFVGVDALVDGVNHRFVTTHLEIQFPAADPLAPGIQAAQASQLIGSLSVHPVPPGSRLLIAGDMNSASTHPLFPDPLLGPFHPPYRQFVNGTDLFGQTISVPYWDVWTLRPGKPRGYTCCHPPDLSNAEPGHEERIDLIFAHPQPLSVKANALDDGYATWPSDHFSVVAELSY